MAFPQNRYIWTTEKKKVKTLSLFPRNLGSIILLHMQLCQHWIKEREPALKNNVFHTRHFLPVYLLQSASFAKKEDSFVSVEKRGNMTHFFSPYAQSAISPTFFSRFSGTRTKYCIFSVYFFFPRFRGTEGRTQKLHLFLSCSNFCTFISNCFNR